MHPLDIAKRHPIWIFKHPHQGLWNRLMLESVATLPLPRWMHARSDRTFMHLGFHIYNLGFQSPDAEAARPLVWTTTLLLVANVLGLNLFAMLVRARLPSRSGGV